MACHGKLSGARMHAYLRGMECGLPGGDDGDLSPEELSGPFLNLIRRVRDRVKQRIANKTVSVNFDANGGGAAPSVSDSTPAGAAPSGSGLPSWAIPAGIAALGLVAVLAMKKGKK